MANIRAHELAKELGFPNKEFLAKLDSIGIKTKTHTSALTKEEEQKARDSFSQKKAVAEPAKQQRTSILRKKAVPPKAPEGVEEIPEEASREEKIVVKKEEKVSKAEPKKVEEKAKEDKKLEAHREEKKSIPAEEKPIEIKDILPVVHQPDKVIIIDKPQKPAEAPGYGKRKDHKKVDIQAQREKNFYNKAGGYHKHKKKDTEPVEAKKTEITVPKAGKRVIKIEEAINVGEMAHRMGIKANDLIKKLFSLGAMVTINQSIDADVAAIVASEFGFEVEVAANIEEAIEFTPDKPEDLKKRPPVVTIMGHVDHGKTSLLDAVRKTNVMGGEAGGITQHIGAYDVKLESGDVVFLDTPGHEAFTAMRARGAQVTDIVVLVVAADDGVMPQTKEAINHAKAANVPIIVAVNKIDKPNANTDRVKQALSDYGLIPEAWGGQTIYSEISAKMGTGIKDLLEILLLQADVLELKANPNKPARGTIIEAKLDKGRGPVATVLVQEGTLKVGDTFVTGIYHGRVRAMINDKGQKVTSVGPSTPVEVLGLPGVPQGGDSFIVAQNEKKAKELAEMRLRKQREAELSKSSKVSLEELYTKIQSGDVKELNLIIKGDVQGSVEALGEALIKLSTDAVKVKIIHGSVGAINESDVMLASASNAIIVGFNVRPEGKTTSLAETEGVDMKFYNIIYNVIDDVKKAMVGLLEPITKEVVIGTAEVRNTFFISKIGTIAGCSVQTGKIARGAGIRLLRDNMVIHTGKLSSLKRFKDDAKEVTTGYECGIGIENYNDVKVGDIIEAFITEKVAATL